MAANTEQPSSSSKPPKEDQPKEDQPKDSKKILTDFLKDHLQNLTHKQPAAHVSSPIFKIYFLYGLQYFKIIYFYVIVLGESTSNF